MLKRKHLDMFLTTINLLPQSLKNLKTIIKLDINSGFKNSKILQVLGFAILFSLLYQLPFALICKQITGVKNFLVILIIFSFYFCICYRQNTKYIFFFINYVLLGSGASILFLISISTTTEHTNKDILERAWNWQYFIGAWCFAFAYMQTILISSLIKNKIGSILIFCLNSIILSIPIIITCCNALCLCFSDATLTTNSILAFMQTDPKEAYEFILSQVKIERLILLLLVVSSYFFSVKMLFRSIKEELKISKIGGGIDKSIFINILLCVVLLILIAGQIHKKRNNIFTFPFINFYVLAQEFKQFRTSLQQRAEMLTSLQGTTNKINGTYVVVIGESLNKEFMSAYGYSKPTTPMLDEKISHNPNLILMTNTFSCHTHTVPVLQYLLTFKNQYQTKEQQNTITPSIIEIARYLGQFETHWLSGQNISGPYDTPTTIISKSANHQFFVEHPDFSYNDYILLDKFKNLAFDGQNNNLIFIHLQGNHSLYKFRYPKNYKKFSDSKVPKQNDYENSVLFNDFILSELYQKAIKIPNFKAFVYLSDHGEDVALGHNADQFVPRMTTIPFYIAFADSYIKDHPEKVAHLKANKDKVFTNDLTYDTLLGLMGMTNNPYYSEANDLLSPTYNMDNKKYTTVYGKIEISNILNSMWYQDTFVNQQKHLDSTATPKP